MLTIKRKSLGRSVQLGQFYDARTDSLIDGCSLFIQAIPANLINSVDTSNTQYRYSLDDSLEKKFENLKIEGQLKASLMAGLVSVQGSGEYLSEHKKSAKSVKGAMVYEVRTKSESINLNNDQLQPFVSVMALQMDVATHVVVGIDWGAKSVATFEYENSDNSEKRQIERKLEGCLKQMGAAISRPVVLDLKYEERKVCDRVSINYYGDFVSHGGLPTSVEETVGLIREVPSLIQQSNNGKGVALEFALMPIKDVENLLSLRSRIDRTVVDLSEQSINRVQQELDYLLVQKQRFYDVKNEIDSNANLFADLDLELLNDKVKKIQLFESEFRSELGKLFVAIRSGNRHPSELDSFLESVQADPYQNSAGIKQFLADNSRVFNRLQQIKHFKSKNIELLDKTVSLSDFIQMNRTKDVYVLVCGDQIASQDSANYQLNRDCFMQLRHEKEEDSESIFLVYDVELHAVNNNPEANRASVVYYSNGRKVDADCRQTMAIWAHGPAARSDEMEFDIKPALQPREYSLPCTSQQIDQKPEIRKVIQIQGTSSRTLGFHSDEVNQVSFLSDRRLASCSDDKTIRVWDRARGQELFTLVGHESTVLTIAVLANGWLASGSEDKTIKVWNLAKKKEVKTLRGHTAGIVSLRVLSNGNLVSCSGDDTIKIWNPLSNDNNNNPLLTIGGHGNRNFVIPVGVLSNDFLVACSRDKENQEDSTLRVWDSRDGRLVKSLPTGLRAVSALLVLSNDQVAIGAGVWGGTIKIVDLEDDSRTKAKDKAHNLAVLSLLQLSNDNLVSSGLDEGCVPSIKLWKFSDLSLLQHIEPDHSSTVYSLSISPDEKTLATGSFDKTIKLWPIVTKDVIQSCRNLMLRI